MFVFAITAATLSFSKNKRGLNISPHIPAVGMWDEICATSFHPSKFIVLTSTRTPPGAS